MGKIVNFSCRKVDGASPTWQKNSPKWFCPGFIPLASSPPVLVLGELSARVDSDVEHGLLVNPEHYHS
jgi:hypothetical protein